MELFDFGIPALDKALNLTATVLLLLALGMLLIRVILRLCDRAFDRSERLAPFRTYLRSTLRAVLYILLALAVLGSIGVEIIFGWKSMILRSDLTLLNMNMSKNSTFA